MNKLNKIVLSLAATATLVSATGTLNAAATNSNLNVTAAVADVCVINSTADVAFGTLTPGGPANNDANGSVTWRCTSGTGVSISIDGSTTRAMTGGTNGDSLTYQLYTDTARTNVFTPEGGAGNVADTGAGMSTPVVTNIHGRVLDADVATVSADTYSDVVSVTLTF